MNPLNDDELDALLRQAKAEPPSSSPELSARTMAAYAGLRRRPSGWQALLSRPIRIPAPAGLLAAAALVAIGAAAGRTLAPPVVVQTRNVEVPVVQEHVVYRDCPVNSQTHGPQTGGLTFQELPPVQEIKPRVVRSIRDDQ